MTDQLSAKYLRPRDAASLIIIDREGKTPRILMGRRHSAMAFMPGKFVFPGGGTDSNDGKVPAFSQLRDDDRLKLLSGMGKSASKRRARALPITAIRETFEETGLMIAASNALSCSDDTPDHALNPIAVQRSNPHPWPDFAHKQLLPDLSVLRYVARAITPPGHVRRYDARFFASFLDQFEPEKTADMLFSRQSQTTLTKTNAAESIHSINILTDALQTDVPHEPELSDLQFVSFEQALSLNIARITRIILLDIQQLLLEDANLSSIYPIPEYSERHGRHVVKVI